MNQWNGKIPSQLCQLHLHYVILFIHIIIIYQFFLNKITFHNSWNKMMCLIICPQKKKIEMKQEQKKKRKKQKFNNKKFRLWKKIHLLFKFWANITRTFQNSTKETMIFFILLFFVSCLHFILFAIQWLSFSTYAFSHANEYKTTSKFEYEKGSKRTTN